MHRTAATPVRSTGKYNSVDSALAITGEGAIPNYNYTLELEVPWYYLRSVIKSVTLETGVTSIGSCAFSGCSGLTSINFNAQNYHASYNNYLYTVFSNCPNLRTVNIGENVTKIPDHLLSYFRSLTSVTMGSSVDTIGNSAFYNCSGLTSITIPNGVTTIGDWAFGNCSGLTSITSHAVTPPECGGNAFGSVPVDIPVYIPCLTILKYKNAFVWSGFTNYIVNGDVTEDTTYYSAVKCYGGIGYTDINFTEPLNGAGLYYAVLPNSSGCDSIICLTHAESPPYSLCMISVDENYHNEIVWKQEDVHNDNVGRQHIIQRFFRSVGICILYGGNHA